ncbi:Helicase associated domain protein [Streptomyces albidoflavus]|uniref:DEAD/DEAH box helicase n=1 Tax=Streptomyces albidoflavus TaxID=1886 RepID=UPI00189D669F|nr:DEAD/DEAH box helicase [Streptomyces albidoflavus]
MTAQGGTRRIALREHQVEATARIREWVGFPTRSAVPEEGKRATVVSATGSGKTITAAWAALEGFRGGRILVMVPTLDLLVQTVQAWRRVGHHGPMVGVCSLEKDEVLEQLGVRTTTNAIQLGLWAGQGPVVVFATYASLVDRADPEDPLGQGKVRGPLEMALAGGERLYGQTMAPFDLAVVDEAHATAGDLGRPWAAIHDNDRIPAGHRLYLTATPRILAPPRPQRGRGSREAEIATMASDPDGPYGEWIYELELAEAVERGILAGFEIDVLEIHDPSPAVGDPSEEERRGRRLALLQTALLEHAAARDLRTVMTFHQRVEEAAAFAEKLPETAGAFARSEADGHVSAEQVWAAWLCGDHLVAERREVLRQFSGGVDAGGRPVRRAFLASVRVLGEGVDIVGERGVEAVCFADTRGSQVEIVQNIGRALRPNPDGTTKTARIIVPVFLQPGEDPSGLIASASYAPLVAVLQGLRSHSERLVEQLADRALSSGRRQVHVKRDAEGRIIGTTAGGEREEAEGAGESALLRFSTAKDAATIAAFLRTRVYRPESLVWLEGYQALLRWREEQHITGVYAVPYDTETVAGVTKAFQLGRWVHQQRRAHRAGELDEHRRSLLDEAGMVWEPGDEAWETKLAVLRSFHRAHGHLAPRRDAVWGDTDRELAPVGEHMANLRRRNGLGKNPERAAARAAQLARIDPDWDCPWPLDWQRHCRVLTRLAADEPGGLLPDIAPGVFYEGDDLGKWLLRQRRSWAELSAEQRDRLARLGVTPVERPAPAPAEAVRVGEGGGKAPAFQRGLAALTQYIEREGAGKAVPRGHVETVVVGGEEYRHKLGVWISNTRSRREKLTGPQRAALAALGIGWA